jgi:sideroflexin-5
MMEDYFHRVNTLMHQCGPQSWRFLFVSREDIEKARMVLKTGGVDDAIMMEAKRTVLATVHADSKEIIPPLFRMAAHVPVNMVLLTAMLMSKSVLGTALTQFLNQGFNALQFYMNGNRSNIVSNSTYYVSFLSATVGAVGVGVAGRIYLEKALSSKRMSPSRYRLLGNMVPFVAAAAAKPLQLTIMRFDEINTGINVYSSPERMDETTLVGKSKRAGGVAVSLTIFTRVLYLAPMLWLPPLYHYTAKGLGLSPASNSMKNIALFTLLSALSSAYATPFCLALFSQTFRMSSSLLEDSIKAAAGVDTVYFNKGL